MDQRGVLFVVAYAGFPDGSATAARVRLLARSLVELGIECEVLLTRASERAGRPIVNAEWRGEWRNVRFEYAERSSIVARGWAARRLRGAKAWGVTMAKVWSFLRCGRFVYLYADAPTLCIPITRMARHVGVPVIGELCEWRPGLPSASATLRWYSRRRRFHDVDGVVAISDWLAARACEARPGIPVLKIPILSDSSEYDSLAAHRLNRHLTWCGNANEYAHSILWMLKALALDQTLLRDRRLLLLGPCSKSAVRQFREAETRLGLPCGFVECRGVVPRDVLLQSLTESALLLAPMHADQRSEARLPTKLGEYLLSGRPVLAGATGEIRSWLTDGDTGFLYEPDNDRSFLTALRAALESDAGERVGASGKALARRSFDYRVHGQRLLAFSTGLQPAAPRLG